MRHVHARGGREHARAKSYRSRLARRWNAKTGTEKSAANDRSRWKSWLRRSRQRLRFRQSRRSGESPREENRGSAQHARRGFTRVGICVGTSWHAACHVGGMCFRLSPTRERSQTLRAENAIIRIERFRRLRAIHRRRGVEVVARRSVVEMVSENTHVFSLKFRKRRGAIWNGQSRIDSTRRTRFVVSQEGFSLSHASALVVSDYSDIGLARRGNRAKERQSHQEDGPA